MIEQDVEHLWLDATGLDELRRAVPDHHRRAGQGRARPGHGLAADRARGPLQLRRDRRRPRRRVVAPRPLGGGRGQLQRRDGRQPPRVQLAARRHGVRPTGGRGHRPRRRRPARHGRDALACSGGGGIGGRRLGAARRSDGSASLDREELQRTMTVNAGVLRSASSLAPAATACAGDVAGDDLGSWELRNLADRRPLAVRGGARARGEPRRPHPHGLRRDPRRPADPVHRRRLTGEQADR